MDIRFTSCCFGFLACLFVAPAAYSQALPKTDYGGTVRLARVAEVNRAAIANSYNTVADYRYNSPLYGSAANDARYAQKGVALGRISLGGMARAAVKSFRGPVTPIILAAQAAQWLYDEDGSVTGIPGEFYQQGSGDVYSISASGGCHSLSGSQLTLSDAASQCQALLGSGWTVGEPYGSGCPESSCTINATRNSDGYTFQAIVASSPEAANQIITDPEMADAIQENADNDLNVARGLAGAAAAAQGLDSSGQPQSNPIAEEWAELQQSLAEQLSALEAAETAADTNADGVLSQSEIDAYNDANPDQLLDVLPPPAPQPDAFEIPTGCQLLPQLCEIRDWLLDPIPEEAPEPTWNVEEFGPADLPEASNPLPSGSATCPAPQQITVFAEPLSISYQPFCDLALMIKPLLLAAASLFAVLLLVRM